MILQKDRHYSLQIGQGKGKGLLIENLHIEFTVAKSANNKKKTNKATLKIYNLSEEHQKYMEAPFVEVVLSVGYADTGLFRLFAGQVTVAGTRKEGSETVTTIQLDSLYTELNNKRVSKTTPSGTSVMGVIKSLTQEMSGVAQVVFSGQNIYKSFIDGYPLTGTPRQIMNELAEAFELEWQVDDGIMYIQDVGFSYMKDSNKAYVLSETSGLLERPYFDNIEKRRGKGDKAKEARNGVRAKILLNPTIVAGSIVRVEYGEFTGFYKVESVVHKGGMYSEDWSSDLVLGTMLKTA